MLTGNELYVVLKLVSGEDVMAVLSSEDNEYIELLSPMCIRTHHIAAVERAHVTAAPLCQFSDDKSFVLHKRNILFIKKLHHAFIPHYRRIVEEQERSVKFKPAVEDDEPMTAEEAMKRIDMLKSLLEDEPEETPITPINFVKGNNTIN